ncbi:metalloregulator ArsR/SmtB family transcription factor [Aurantimonas sp. C2-6-R+9]|uniref:ArsR/SmtB family transcription factor n=1 Tax=unclassified Aurantimonas TaxID=2638230 RepID=UPI002E17E839|nr:MULTISPECIES: metalloregulator ArsR/SmtB family transcription factor [unclassified Aurantimonas]MEC5292751.1 metalloregulator ArsR/SmtB family transcription factor [Aurantimonas sp. C2-3-R2]MEC5383507.1 metalloregulator ArsR/SmtB family transcription factor [Aurantimonas sp. C2-6-R+9]MEC5413785.1 metalloregulator ArsR/SmtB family transcription factor [Aurantimonas sp. C2-4-R8]
MDAIFKALSDPTRRLLLDALREADGQTLTELERRVGMSRFGVMKHLRVLEEASLVVTRKSGRFKHHYLNPAPIQALADRWIEPFRKPWARLAMDLKTALETETPMTKPDFLLETFIRTTPERLWNALLDPAMTEKYYMNSRVETDGAVGSQLRYVWPDGKTMLDGKIIEADPPRRLKATFQPKWDEDQHPVSTVTFEIEAQGEVCKFTITHTDLVKSAEGIRTGWAKIASGLKTLLETGEPLPSAA